MTDQDLPALTPRQVAVVAAYDQLVHAAACIELHGHGDEVLRLARRQNLEAAVYYGMSVFVDLVQADHECQEQQYQQWVQAGPEDRKAVRRYQDLLLAREQTIQRLARERNYEQLRDLVLHPVSADSSSCPECGAYVPYPDQEGLWDCLECGIWWNRQGERQDQ